MKQKLSIRRSLVWGSLTALLLLLMLPGRAAALETRGGESVSIGSGETIADDLMVQADRFTLDGTVDGNLSVVANLAIIRGSVSGNLNIVAREVVFEGRVGQNARIAGQTIVMGERSQVGRDMLVSAVNLQQPTGSVIGRTLAFAGLSATLNGRIGAGSDVTGDRPAGAQGRLMGVLYRVIPGNSESTLTPVHQVVPAEAASAGQSIGPIIRRFFSLLIIGALLLWLAPALIPAAAAQVRSRPWASLLWGVLLVPGFFIAFLALVLAIALLAMMFGRVEMQNMVVLTWILGGLSTVTFLTAFALLLNYVGLVVVGYLIGAWLIDLTGRELKRPRVRAGIALAVGLALTVLLLAIPGIDIVLRTIATLLGMGGLWLLWRMPSVAQSQPVPVVAPAG